MIKFKINKESESRKVLPRGVSSAQKVLNLPLHRSTSQKNSVWEEKHYVNIFISSINYILII